MVNMFVLPTGVVRTDNERTGQSETVRAEGVEMGKEGKIDGVSERSSSTQLLIFCVTETILSSG